MKYKDGKLSDERIGLLNKIQFVWKRNTDAASASAQKNNWDAMFGLVEGYKATPGTHTTLRSSCFRRIAAIAGSSRSNPVSAVSYGG